MDCLSQAPSQGPGPQPRQEPWPGIKRVTVHFAGQHPTHWATLVRATLFLSGKLGSTFTADSSQGKWRSYRLTCSEHGRGPAISRRGLLCQEWEVTSKAHTVISEEHVLIEYTHTHRVVPPYLGGIHFKMPSGCLRLWIVLNSIYSMFFPNIHAYDTV